MPESRSCTCASGMPAVSHVPFMMESARGNSRQLPSPNAARPATKPVASPPKSIRRHESSQLCRAAYAATNTSRKSTGSMKKRPLSTKKLKNAPASKAAQSPGNKPITAAVSSVPKNASTRCPLENDRKEKMICNRSPARKRDEYRHFIDVSKNKGTCK